MTNKILSPQQLKAVCDILGNTNEGFTKTELTRLLQQSQIVLMDDGNTHTDYGYKIGLNKRDWLYSCLANEIDTSKSLKKVYQFIMNALRVPNKTEKQSKQQQV